jgi:endonuclease/exonuclease/phosphatase family metal-dependent hydrolase
MQWEYLEHSRKHKGSAIVIFPTLRVRQAEGEVSPPVVVAACHLSHGLTDAAVVAKKQEVHDLMKHLQSAFAGNPCIMAGDFNLTSSSYTIDMARKKGALSNHTLEHLRDVDSCFRENGFRDVWLETRLETGESSGIQAVQQNLDQLHEGEQGATFDPLINTLAAKQVGFGLGTRPQRYDRIFVNDALGLHPVGFNMFGQETEEGAAQYASDHWGVRCLLQVMESNSAAVPGLVLARPVTLRRAAENLGGLEDLTACLSTRGMLPTKEDEASRVEAVELLRRVLVDEITSQGHGDRHFKPVLVLIPVGSTALGVWTLKSDIDCLCVGGISSKTFFALATKRLKKASPEGITILRKVRANSGTMLELLVQGIRFDLQYCPSIMIAEQSVFQSYLHQ